MEKSKEEDATKQVQDPDSVESLSQSSLTKAKLIKDASLVKGSSPVKFKEDIPNNAMIVDKSIDVITDKDIGEEAGGSNSVEADMSDEN